MKQFFIFTLSLFLALSCGSVDNNNTKVAEVVFSSDEIIPSNMVISDQGDFYVSINPMINPSTKLYQISVDGVVSPYPNIEYSVGENSIIGGVIGVKIDNSNNLWILDLVDPKFVVWSLTDNTLVDTILIPDAVLRANSFLQDFVIDQKGERVVIADMTLAMDTISSSPAFVVYDMKNETFARIGENHPTLMAEIEEGFDLNPIAIDSGSEWIYYGALNGRKLYRAPASSFADDSLFVEGVQFFSSKPYSDGIVVADNGVVYITNIEDNAIAATEDGGYMNISLLPQGQVWPDGLFVGSDGYIYSTVSQLGAAAVMNNGVDNTTLPYIIVREELVY